MELVSRALALSATPLRVAAQHRSYSFQGESGCDWLPSIPDGIGNRLSIAFRSVASRERKRHSEVGLS